MKKINSLTVLKFVAMLLIVWWHLGAPSRDIAWGSRMCEFLFVASGFLIGYNYYQKGMIDSSAYAAKYVWQKLLKIWPLHVITLCLIIGLHYRWYILDYQTNDIFVIITHLFLMQAWCPNVEGDIMTYNYVSWFLSALLFCYYVSPILIKFIKSKRSSIIMFCLVAGLRFALEFWSINTLFSFVMHTSPIIRALEFFLGMLMVPIFMSLKELCTQHEKKTWFTMLWSLVEIVALVGCVWLMYLGNTTWIRCYFVWVFCALTFVFAFDYGLLSKICSWKVFGFLAAVQLEIYLCQVVISRAFDIFLKLTGWQLGFVVTFGLKIVLLFGVALVYRYFIAKWLAKGLAKVGKGVKKIFVKTNDPDIEQK